VAGGLFAAAAASGFLDAGDATTPLAAGDVDNTIARTGPGLLTRTFCGNLGRLPPGTVCLPYVAFYAAPNDAENPAEHATPGSLALHLWARSWQK